MMITTWNRFALAGVLVVLSSLPASADGTAKKFPLKGSLVSGSIAASTPGPAVVISAATAGYDAGSGKVLVVKSICGKSTANMVLQIGTSQFVYTGIGSGCVNFEPGFVADEGQDVLCGADGGGTTSATVSGIVTGK